MVDLKVADPLISNLLALQKTLAPTKKADAAQPTEAKQPDDAVRVDIDVRLAELANASPPLDQTAGGPAITQHEARDMALEVGQNLKASDVPLAGNSEKVILGLFT